MAGLQQNTQYPDPTGGSATTGTTINPGSFQVSPGTYENLAKSLSNKGSSYSRGAVMPWEAKTDTTYYAPRAAGLEMLNQYSNLNQLPTNTPVMPPEDPSKPMAVPTDYSGFAPAGTHYLGDGAKMTNVAPIKPEIHTLTPGGEYAGQYVLDKAQPGALVKSVRGYSDDIRKAVLAGRSAKGYQWDHIMPLELGGTNTLGNLQIQNIYDTDRKTRVQAVPATLLAHGKITLGQARVMSMTWKDKDASFIPQPSKTGLLSLEDAQKAVNIWNKDPNKVSFKQALAATPDVMDSWGRGPMAEFKKSFVTQASMGFLPHKEYEDATTAENVAAIAGDTLGFLAGMIGAGALLKGAGSLAVRGATAVAGRTVLSRVGTTVAQKAFLDTVAEASSAAIRARPVAPIANLMTAGALETFAKAAHVSTLINGPALVAQTAALIPGKMQLALKGGMHLGLYEAAKEVISNRYSAPILGGTEQPTEAKPLRAYIEGQIFGTGLAFVPKSWKGTAGVTAATTFLSLVSDPNHPTEALSNGLVMGALHRMGAKENEIAADTWAKAVDDVAMKAAYRVLKTYDPTLPEIDLRKPFDRRMLTPEFRDRLVKEQQQTLWGELAGPAGSAMEARNFYPEDLKLERNRIIASANYLLRGSLPESMQGKVRLDDVLSFGDHITQPRQIEATVLSAHNYLQTKPKAYFTQPLVDPSLPKADPKNGFADYGKIAIVGSEAEGLDANTLNQNLSAYFKLPPDQKTNKVYFIYEPENAYWSKAKNGRLPAGSPEIDKNPENYWTAYLISYTKGGAPVWTPVGRAPTPYYNNVNPQGVNMRVKDLPGAERIEMDKDLLAAAKSKGESTQEMSGTPIRMIVAEIDPVLTTEATSKGYKFVVAKFSPETWRDTMELNKFMAKESATNERLARTFAEQERAATEEAKQPVIPEPAPGEVTTDITIKTTGRPMPEVGEQTIYGDVKTPMDKTLFEKLTIAQEKGIISIAPAPNEPNVVIVTDTRPEAASVSSKFEITPGSDVTSFAKAILSKPEFKDLTDEMRKISVETATKAETSIAKTAPTPATTAMEKPPVTAAPKKAPAAEVAGGVVPTTEASEMKREVGKTVSDEMPTAAELGQIEGKKTEAPKPTGKLPDVAGEPKQKAPPRKIYTEHTMSFMQEFKPGEARPGIKSKSQFEAAASGETTATLRNFAEKKAGFHEREAWKGRSSVITGPDGAKKRVMLESGFEYIDPKTADIKKISEETGYSEEAIKERLLKAAATGDRVAILRWKNLDQLSPEERAAMKTQLSSKISTMAKEKKAAETPTVETKPTAEPKKEPKPAESENKPTELLKEEKTTEFPLLYKRTGKAKTLEELGAKKGGEGETKESHPAVKNAKKELLSSSEKEVEDAILSKLQVAEEKGKKFDASTMLGNLRGALGKFIGRKERELSKFTINVPAGTFKSEKAAKESGFFPGKTFYSGTGVKPDEVAIYTREKTTPRILKKGNSVEVVSYTGESPKLVTKKVEELKRGDTIVLTEKTDTGEQKIYETLFADPATSLVPAKEGTPLFKKRLSSSEISSIISSLRMRGTSIINDIAGSSTGTTIESDLAGIIKPKSLKRITEYKEGKIISSKIAKSKKATPSKYDLPEYLLKRAQEKGLKEKHEPPFFKEQIIAEDINKEGKSLEGPKYEVVPEKEGRKIVDQIQKNIKDLPDSDPRKTTARFLDIFLKNVTLNEDYAKGDSALVYDILAGGPKTEKIYKNLFGRGSLEEEQPRAAMESQKKSLFGATKEAYKKQAKETTKTGEAGGLSEAEKTKFYSTGVEAAQAQEAGLKVRKATDKERDVTPGEALMGLTADTKKLTHEEIVNGLYNILVGGKEGVIGKLNKELKSVSGKLYGLTGGKRWEKPATISFLREPPKGPFAKDPKSIKRYEEFQKLLSDARAQDAKEMVAEKPAVSPEVTARKTEMGKALAVLQAAEKGIKDYGKQLTKEGADLVKKVYEESSIRGTAAKDLSRYIRENKATLFAGPKKEAGDIKLISQALRKNISELSAKAKELGKPQASVSEALKKNPLTKSEPASKVGGMKEIFVFGSNLKGIHGAGAAKTAKEQHGAIYGQGEGLQGNSYAIPTKETPYKTLPLEEIKKYVDTFIKEAKKNPDTTYNLTAIGTGLAGYKPEQIAPMFKDAPSNVKLPKEFKQ